MQQPILTVTLNPALDRTTATDRVEPNLKLRCDAPKLDPGGGGINVSRAIRLMGGSSTALVALGGATGIQMADLLGEAKIRLLRMTAPGETRQSLAVTDCETGNQFRFVMPGPQWRGQDVAEALALIADSARAGGYVVLSGSNPPGVPASFARLTSDCLTGCDCGLIVDTSGAGLADIAGAGCNIAALRMDDAEAEELARRPLPTRADTAAFAVSLRDAGAARMVLIARGRDGNIIAGPDGVFHAEAAKVPIDSMVGAGDSFLAGFTLGLARGLSTADALGLAAAAASSAVMTPATELVRPDDVQRLYDARVVTRL